MKTLILFAALLAGCGLSPEAIQSEIDRANYCTTVADCGDAGSHCPFGCNILVNEAEVPRIRQLVESESKSSCVYDCAQLVSMACESRRCVARY